MLHGADQGVLRGEILGCTAALKDSTGSLQTGGLIGFSSFKRDFKTFVAWDLERMFQELDPTLSDLRRAQDPSWARIQLAKAFLSS